MFKTIPLALTALCVAVGPAAALFCVKPDPAAAFQFAAQSDNTYVVLRGTFDFDVGKLPDPLGPPLQAVLSADFKGKLLTGDGFTDAVEVPVTIGLNCVGPWCARVSPGTDYMAFVIQKEQQLIFSVSPCYQFAFAKPSDDMVAVIEQCAAGGACTPEQPQ